MRFDKTTNELVIPGSGQVLWFQPNGDLAIYFDGAAVYAVESLPESNFISFCQRRFISPSNIRLERVKPAFFQSIVRSKTA